MKQNLLRFFLSCLFLIGVAYAQNRQVSGKVTSAEDGTALAGVSVSVQGTSTATQTDASGNFSINAPTNGTLVFTYVGFQRQTVSINNRAVVNVSMSSDAAALDEVVVTAYGVQTRESIAGSITSLSSEDIAETQSGNVMQSLTGKVGGVQIRSTTGQPGAAPSVRFRGVGSISSSNEPLYVVDGVPYNGDVAAIAAQDIDQITFLKDAAANALYGSRGANGVVIITTKKGKGEVKVNYESRVGFNSRSIKDYETVDDPIRYYELRWERLKLGNMYDGQSASDAAANASKSLVKDLGYNIFNVPNDQVIDPSTGRINPQAKVLYQDNWHDALFKNSVRHEHTLNIQQGGDTYSSYLSAGYLKDNGYVVNSGFDRISSRLNLEYNPFQPIKLGGNVSFASTKARNPQAGKATNTFSNLFMWTRSAAPIYPIWARDKDGSFLLDENGDKQYDWGRGETLNYDGSRTERVYISDMNPYASTMEDIHTDQNKNINLRAFASVDFLNYFNFTYNLGYDYRDSYRLRSSTALGGDASSQGGSLTNATLFQGTLTNQQLLTFKKDFDNHDLDIMIGHESSEMESKMLAGSKTLQVLPDYNFISNYTKFSGLNGYNDYYKVEGYLSRVNYNYDNKYFVNASYRRDGSSVFHPDHRWGNFFGIGAAWLISKEDFFRTDVFSNLKFKISYGEQGNDNLYYPGYVAMSHRSHFGFSRNYYPYMTQYEITPDAEGNPSIREVYLGNEELKWEVSRNFNTGFEMTLFNRVNVDVEYFQRAVSDMLFNFPLPPSSGNPSISRNIGNMRNRGVELSVDADIVRNQDLGVNLWVNATKYKNKITKLPDPFVSGVFRFVEGESSYTYYLREYAGVDADNGNSQWYMGDRDKLSALPTGDKTITDSYTSATQYLQKGKTGHPDLYGGFGFSIDYKKFTLAAGFAYQIGGYVYDDVYSSFFREGTGFGNSGHSFHKDISKTWTPDNKSATLPMMTSVDRTQFGTSDLFLTKADYLSFENFSIGYNLSGDAFERVKIRNAKLSVFGSNLGVLSKRKGLDPRMMQLGGEVNNGLTLNSYSLLRSISLGLTLNF